MYGINLLIVFIFTESVENSAEKKKKKKKKSLNAE